MNSIVDQNMPPLLSGTGIGKQFGGETALDDVSFELSVGEIHGLVGSNGAGKSTLMKILAGVLPDHEGTIRLDGKEVQLSSPREASRLGIAMVHQELSNIGQLSVAENVLLGRQPRTGLTGRIDWRRMRSEAREALSELGLTLDVNRRLDSFPLVTQQMVEIARGLHSGARVLILDEPTSALSPPEIRRFFELMQQLKRRGVAMIFISHFIEDVLEICDRVTILKDGRKVDSVESRKTDRVQIIHRMLGHNENANDGDPDGRSQLEAAALPESEVKLPKRKPGQAVLYAENLVSEGRFGPLNLSVLPGECLGLYGFVGAGHQELVHAIGGSIAPDEGIVFTNGQNLPSGKVHKAIDNGVVMVAADRTQTLIRSFPIHENTTMAHLKTMVGSWFTKGKSIRVTQPLLHRVHCEPPNPRLRAGSLSGGNQQKVVLAKWLSAPIRVLLLEEPTRGMDVGAKAEILALIRELKEQGTAVILASTEPELILSEADRILVFHRGRIVKELLDTTASKSILTNHASGT